MFLLGYRQVSAPLVKLQKTLNESLEQPWLGSIQYSPTEGSKETKQGGKPFRGRCDRAGGGSVFRSALPSLSSGWLRCRSWQVRAGLSWVPRGKRKVSISCRRELSEPKISSMPSVPIRNSVPAASDAGMSMSGSSWLASMERFDLGLLCMGRG